MRELTVVGGGLAGLVASITCAEAGQPVRLIEAQRRLGGRARSTDGPFVCNFGPHVFYSDGPWWPWLSERGLLPPNHRVPVRGLSRLRFRHRGERRRTPPAALMRALKLVRCPAPAESGFRTWVAGVLGEEDAETLSRAAGVFTFDHDPGRLSAAFVWERLVRVATKGFGVRYVRGGWCSVVERLERHARTIGVRIHTGDLVSALPDPPVIVATGPAAARRLLDQSILWEGTRAALLDIGLMRRGRDPYVVSDLDEGGWIEQFSLPDPTLVPPGHALFQAHIGLRPDEELDAGIARLETLLEVGIPGWRERCVWRRRGIAEEETGALDLPGYGWRDRPSVDRGEGIFLAGDMVAAPGLLSEVSLNSAVAAASAALARAGGRSRVGIGATPTSREGSQRWPASEIPRTDAGASG